MSEKTTSGKVEPKPVIAKNEASKPSTASNAASTATAEKKSKETTDISGESPKKTDAPQSASQTSTSHFQAFQPPSIVLAGIKFLGNQK